MTLWLKNANALKYIFRFYRVPGNNAAVSSLTEAVNRGFDVTILDQDPRWSDVNVISSLLKSFFRKLPDALLTSELYPLFIQANQIRNVVSRMQSLRKLVSDHVLIVSGYRSRDLETHEFDCIDVRTSRSQFRDVTTSVIPSEESGCQCIGQQDGSAKFGNRVWSNVGEKRRRYGYLG